METKPRIFFVYRRGNNGRMIGWFSKSRFVLHQSYETFDCFDEFGRLVGVMIGEGKARQAVIVARDVFCDVDYRSGLSM